MIKHLPLLGGVQCLVGIKITRIFANLTFPFKTQHLPRLITDCSQHQEAFSRRFMTNVHWESMEVANYWKQMAEAGSEQKTDLN